MAEEREGLPQNPAQMMRDKNKAAADSALAKHKAADERRAASRQQTQADVKDFTPEDESFEMEGSAAPKAKPAEKKAAPKAKPFAGKGGFEYEFDEESQAFTITGAPEEYKHLKGKKVTSGKAYDSIKAEMETGASLYEAPEPVTLPEEMPENLEDLSPEQQELLGGQVTASHDQMIGGSGAAGSEGRLQNLHPRVKNLMAAVEAGQIRPYEFEAKTGILFEDAQKMIAESEGAIARHEAGYESEMKLRDTLERLGQIEGEDASRPYAGPGSQAREYERRFGLDSPSNIDNPYG